jgi:hypothetical protein
MEREELTFEQLREEPDSIYSNTRPDPAVSGNRPFRGFGSGTRDLHLNFRHLSVTGVTGH